MKYFLYRIPMSCTRSGDREIVLVAVDDNQGREDADRKFVDFPDRAPILERRGYTCREIDLSTGVSILDTVIC